MTVAMKTLQHSWHCHTRDISTAALSQSASTKQYIATVGPGDRRLNVWLFHRQQPLHSFPTGALQITTLCINLYYIVVGSTTGAIRIWNLQSGRALSSSSAMQAHTSSITALSIHSCGQTLASGSADGRIQLYNINQKQQATVVIDHNSNIRCSSNSSPTITAIKHSPDDQWITVCDSLGNVTIYNTQQGQLIHQFTTEQHLHHLLQATAHHIAYHPSDFIVAIGTSSAITVLDLENFSVIFTIQYNTAKQNVQALMFTSTGNGLLLITDSAIHTHSLEANGKDVETATTSVEWPQLCDITYKSSDAAEDDGAVSTELLVICRNENTLHLHQLDTTPLILAVDAYNIKHVGTRPPTALQPSSHSPPMAVNPTHINSQRGGSMNDTADHSFHQLDESFNASFQLQPSSIPGGHRQSLAHTSSHWSASTQPVQQSLHSPHKKPAQHATLTTPNHQQQHRLSIPKSVAPTKFTPPKYVLDQQKTDQQTDTDYVHLSPQQQQQQQQAQPAANGRQNSMSVAKQPQPQFNTPVKSATKASSATPYFDLLSNEHHELVCSTLQQRLDHLQYCTKLYRKQQYKDLLLTLIKLADDEQVLIYNVLNLTQDCWSRNALLSTLETTSEYSSLLLPLIEALLQYPTVHTKQCALQLLQQILQATTPTQHRHAFEFAVHQHKYSEVLKHVQQQVQALSTGSSNGKEMTQLATDINFRLQRL